MILNYNIGYVGDGAQHLMDSESLFKEEYMLLYT